MPNFSEADRSRLLAFLDVVQQIKEASIVAQGQSLVLHGSQHPGQDPVQEFILFADEAFRSLAISVRLVYLNRELANFGGICNLLYKNGEPKFQEAVQSTRTAYNGLLNGPMLQLNLHGDLEGTVVGTRDIFEAWLYGGTFHQDDPAKKAIHNELKKYGPSFTFGLQLFIRKLVDQILLLGAIVTTALEKEEKSHPGGQVAN
jgi:hypothetical protein